ncbi:MAG TPA: VWA domain-containing protein [Syntrophales bacterium]|nr:VWA domain-containing protein [Syntrophales bacterium]
MDRTLEDFITALRRCGVRVSVAETMDALRAVELSGYGDRQRVKNFLSASLAKSLAEKKIFEVCFNRFFDIDYISGEDFLFENSGTSPVVQGVAFLTRALLAGDGGGLALALNEAAGKADVRNIQFPTQKGLYMQRLFQELGMEALDRDIRKLTEEGSPDSLAQVKALEPMRDNIIEKVSNLIERQLELYAGRRSDEQFEGYMRNASLSVLDERNLARIHKIVQRMIKRLKDRHSRRQKAARMGRLDFKKTLRQSLTYGGLPFDTRWKSKKIDRPEVIAICDVSRSVSNVVRFLLLILYSLNEYVPRIRSFIFCSNLVEVSPLFEKYPLQEALARLRSGAELPILMNRTDYGVSFLDFRDQYSNCLTKGATVIIMGDARNNYWNPRTEVLRFISERCKRLIWLNPETPSLWGSGDSEMKTYLPYCSVARECSTLRHLEKVVEYLLRVN